MKPYMHKRISILAQEHPFERQALTLCLAALMCLSCVYVYLVTTSVLHIMGQREAEKKSISMESSIASLEQNYFALSQSITPGTANTLGLAPITDTQYVYRQSTVGQIDTSSARM